MLTAIRVPSLDSSSTKAVLLRWLVKPGDAVQTGTAVAEIETEKAAFPVESACAGTVQEFLVNVQQEIPVGTAIATLETRDTGVTKFDPNESIAAKEVVATAVRSDLYACTETSRVLFNDAFPAQTPALPPPLRPSETGADAFAARNVGVAETRKLLGSALRTQQRMLWSARNIPSSSVTYPLELGALRARVEAHRAATKQLLNVTDVIIWAAARTLPNYPELNAYRCGEELRIYQDVNVGVVYDIQGELIVPAVTHANTLGVLQLADELRALYRAVTARKLPVAKLGVATFTLSNLFGSGATHASPLVNAGQSAVLLIGAPFTAPVESRDALRFAVQLNLILGFDHSIVNGARAAAFLKTVARTARDAEF